MAVDPARAKSIFLAASEIANPVDRIAFLDRMCGEADLRARIEELLRAHDAATLVPEPGSASDTRAPESDAPETNTFGNPDGTSTADHADADERIGTVIAEKYALVEVIGEGGMGSVWRARQTEPVKRAVAVKLIKAGMDSKQVLARFEAERQALALMDHPNIAKVLDGGMHGGRPFFVMELVKGVPITEYCDHHRLTPKERLELFVPVCQAIQHAHQKGVIHRDIKPSNVLIALYDDRPVVKVIDFGVAKATGAPLTEHTIDTGFGGVVGTPQYMSPEQATFNNLDIDTRSDVYALGVLLYELLTGSPPFSKKELEKKGLLEILRVVREEEPPRPSTKLSTAEALPSLSANRSTEPKRLTNLLRNELDWIVMKALEKDRSRRYETANGFAADVQRYLAGEPVLAHPPSAGYRLRKFVRRNQPQVIAVGLVLGALVAGVIGTTLGLVRADRATEAERQAKNDAVEQKGLAEYAVEQEHQARQREAERADGELRAKQREAERADGEQRAKLEAQRNLAFAKKANDILGSVFAELDPQQIAESGRPLQDVLRENLIHAVKELEGAAIGDPLKVAAMQNTLGKSLLSLGERPLAAEIFKKALATRESKLAPDDDDVLMSTINLASAYLSLGQPDDAAKLLERTLEKCRAKLDPNNLLTIICSSALALTYQDLGRLDKAVPLFEQALEKTLATRGPNHTKTIDFMDELAVAYQASGQLDKAMPLLEQALEKSLATRRPDDPRTLSIMGNLALAYEAGGDLARAVPLLERVLEKRKALLGPDHPSTLHTINNLALAYQNSNRLDKAQPMLEQALEKGKTKFGPDHAVTVTTMCNLATVYQERGRLDLAVPLLEQALEKRKAKSGPDHPDTLITMCNLAEAYRASGQPNKAVPLLEETLDKQMARIGPDHPATLSSMNNLAMTYWDSGRREKAVPLMEQTLEKRKIKLGPDHPNTLVSMYNLATKDQELGQLNKAVPLLEETLDKCKAKLGPYNRVTLLCMNHLATAYQALRQFDKSVQLFEQAMDGQKALLGPDHPDTLSSMYNLASAYQNTNQLKKAVPLFEETLAKQTIKLGRDHAKTHLTMNNLAIAYQTTGRPDKAVPLLEETLEKEKVRPGPDDPDTLRTMYNLASAYQVLRQLDKAVPLFEETLEKGTTKLGPDNPIILLSMNNLAAAYRMSGQAAKAVPLLEQALGKHKTQFGSNHPDTLNCMANLGKSYAECGQGEKAAHTLVAFVDAMRKRFPKDSPQFAGLLAQVSLDLLGCGQHAAAEPLLRESLAIREKAEPNVWITFNTRSMLGGSLLGQKKYADAEPLLLAGYEGMKQREAKIPSQGKDRLPEAVEWLVQLYEATGKKDETAKWRLEQAKYPVVAPMPREKK